MLIRKQQDRGSHFRENQKFQGKMRFEKREDGKCC
jgi:hypothetical protein